MLKVNETILESDSQAYREQVICDFTSAIRKIADVIVERGEVGLTKEEKKIVHILKMIRMIKEE